MACYHPLWANYYPHRPDAPKTPVKVYSGSDPPDPYVDSITGELVEPFRIPCGKCIGCRLDYSRSWADRCTMEALDHPPDSSWFVTLTYDDDHLPPAGSAGIHTLEPTDMTLFIKRLRERWSRVYSTDNIRYYYAGEYGSTTFRPHYHILLFGLWFSDLSFYKSNFDGDALYSSSELDSLWSKGFCTIAPFSWSTAAYTARYVVKKVKGKGSASLYESAGIIPEFVRMSRRPGIGWAHMSDILDSDKLTDYIQLPSGRSCSYPKYMMRILKDSDPLSYDKIHSQRVSAMQSVQFELSKLTSLPYDRYLANCEKSKIRSILALQRKEI